jgi:hypothetical protein
MNRILNISISIDLEMLWGLLHRIDATNDSYLTNIEAVPRVANNMLDFFESRKCVTSWGAVDALRFSNAHELYAFLNVNNLEEGYRSLMFDIEKKESIFGSDLLFAPSLIERLENSPLVELGSHSFTHSAYCGDLATEALSELEILASAANFNFGKNSRSPFYIFPRNSYNRKLVTLLQRNGFKSYRGVATSRIYSQRSNASMLLRALRKTDTYMGLFEPSKSALLEYPELSIRNHRATIFFRPATGQILLQQAQLNRLKKHLEYCSKNGLTAHIWWHPHNFSSHFDENMDILEKMFDFMDVEFDLINWKLMCQH